MSEPKVESDGPERKIVWTEKGGSTLGDLLGEAGRARMRTSITGGGLGGGDGVSPSIPTIKDSEKEEPGEVEQIIIDTEDPEGTARSLDSFVSRTEKEMRELGSTAPLQNLQATSSRIKELVLEIATESDPNKVESLETELDTARDRLMQAIENTAPRAEEPPPPAAPSPQKKRRITAAEVAAMQRAAVKQERAVPPYIEKPHDGIVLRHKRSGKVTPPLDRIATYEDRVSKKMERLRIKMRGVSMPPALESLYAERSGKLWSLAERAYAEENRSAQESLSQEIRELVVDIEQNILPQVEHHIKEARGVGVTSPAGVSTPPQGVPIAQVPKPVLNMPMKAPAPSSSPSEEPVVDLSKNEEGILADAWEKQGWGTRSTVAPASAPVVAPASSPATPPSAPTPGDKMAPGDVGHTPTGGMQGGNLEIFTNKARDAYIARYQHYMRYEQSGMRRLRNLVGSPHKESSLPPELRELREKYEEEVSRFAHNYSETRRRELEAHGYRKEDIDKAVRMETFQRFVIGEQLQLQKAKAESLPPRKESLVKRAFKWYGTLPLWARAAISTTAITGFTLATGGIATAAGIGAFAGVGFARAFAGGLLAQVAGAVYEGSIGKVVRARAERRQTAAQETLQSSFAFGNKEEVRKALDQYTAILAQKEKSEKWLRRGKMATMMGAGLGAAMSINMAAALESTQAGAASLTGASAWSGPLPPEVSDPANIDVPPNHYDPSAMDVPLSSPGVSPPFNPYDPANIDVPPNHYDPSAMDVPPNHYNSPAVDVPGAPNFPPIQDYGNEAPLMTPVQDFGNENPLSRAEAGVPDIDAEAAQQARFNTGYYNVENEAPYVEPLRSHTIAQGGSKWASVREILKANAAEFGYDANGKMPLDKWAETQTANLIKANPEFARLNKVFAGDVVTLQKGPGGIELGFETKNEWGLKAGILESRGVKLPAEAGVVDSGGGTSPEAPSTQEGSPRLSEADLNRVVDTNVRAWVNNEWSSRGLWGMGKRIGMESSAWTEYRGMSLKNLESLKNQIRTPGEAVTWWSNIQGLSRETGIPIDPNSTVEQYLRNALKQRLVGQLGESAPTTAPTSSSTPLPRGTRSA